jgi:hypothetical protein
MNYKIDYLDFGDGRPLMHFAIEDNPVLDTFFATDVLQFSDLLVRTINKVLKDKSRLEECSFNQCSVRIEKGKTLVEDIYADDATKACCEVSTAELLELIKEWRKQSKLLQK